MDERYARDAALSAAGWGHPVHKAAWEEGWDAGVEWQQEQRIGRLRAALEACVEALEDSPACIWDSGGDGQQRTYCLTHRSFRTCDEGRVRDAALEQASAALGGEA